MSGADRRMKLLPSVVLLTSLACALPSLSLLQDAPEIPPSDDDSIATMVVGTARSLSALTQQARPTVAATATARATSTPGATSIPAVTSTKAPQESTAHSKLIQREDGSALFSDDLGGYQLAIPAGWTPVRVNEAEYFEALDSLESAEPEMQKALAAILDEDPAVMRLFAFDMAAGHLQNGVVSTISIEWNEQDAMSLASDADLQTEANVLRGMIADVEVLTVEVRITPTGIQHGLITARWPQQTASGTSVLIFQEQAFLKFGPGRLLITLLTTDGLKDALLPAFDQMIAGTNLWQPE